MKTHIQAFETDYEYTQISNVAIDLLNHFPNHKIFTFTGDLGAGKTTLIKSICDHLKVKDEVTSPTFAIVSVYQTEKGQSVNHIDCYRLENVDEAISIGMDDYLYNNQYCFIEWPKVIEVLLPDHYVEVKMETRKNELRSLMAKEICKNNTNQK